MNRDFVYDHEEHEHRNVLVRAVSTLSKWLWGALCCGIPGVPCFFCACCRTPEPAVDRERSCVSQSTTTAERMARPHRPHAPRSRKTTPELLSAVKCALTQLQGEPAPPHLIPPLTTAIATAVATTHSVQPG